MLRKKLWGHKKLNELTLHELRNRKRSFQADLDRELEIYTNTQHDTRLGSAIALRVNRGRIKDLKRQLDEIKQEIESRNELSNRSAIINPTLRNIANKQKTPVTITITRTKTTTTMPPTHDQDNQPLIQTNTGLNTNPNENDDLLNPSSNESQNPNITNQPNPEMEELKHAIRDLQAKLREKEVAHMREMEEQNKTWNERLAQTKQQLNLETPYNLYSDSNRPPGAIFKTPKPFQYDDYSFPKPKIHEPTEQETNQKMLTFIREMRESNQTKDGLITDLQETLKKTNDKLNKMQDKRTTKLFDDNKDLRATLNRIEQDQRALGVRDGQARTGCRGAYLRRLRSLPTFNGETYEKLREFLEQFLRK